LTLKQKGEAPNTKTICQIYVNFAIQLFHEMSHTNYLMLLMHI